MAFWRSRLCNRAFSHPESLQGSDALTAFVSIIRGCPFLVVYSYCEGSEDQPPQGFILVSDGGATAFLELLRVLGGPIGQVYEFGGSCI
jgi:hypothetical protein